MAAYVFRRLLQSVLILVGVTLVTFLLLYVVPADPAQIIAGRGFGTQEMMANIRHQLGLDLPFYEQYWRYLSRLLQGDLGRSYLQKTEVASLLWSRLPATAQLIAGAIFFEIAIGMTLGLLASMWRGTRFDRALMVASFVIVSAPQFVVGILLLYVFAIHLGWFPIHGYGGVSHLFLPALTLGVLGAGWYSRIMRSSMIDVLRQDFIRTARAKGLTRRRALFKHGLRTALIPMATLFAYSVAALVTGAVFTEKIFGWHGIGEWVVQGIATQDTNIIAAVTVFTGAAVLLAGLLSDVIYAALDPRVRVT